VKVLHIPFCFFPDPVGGTEVYVEALVFHQQKKGLGVAIAAPGHKKEFYAHKNLSVYRFPVSGQVHDLSELYGKGIAGGAEAFDEILEKEKPDVLHVHAFTPGLSSGILERAQARRIPVVFTYHTPTVSCQRGTLLRWGQEVCDGRLDVQICSGCTLQGLGVPGPLSALLGRVPSSWGRKIGSLGLSGGPWTALRMPHLLEQRFEAFHRFMNQVDRIIVPCDWARAVLARNNVDAEKISVSRQGLTADRPPTAALRHWVFGGRQRRSGVGGDDRDKRILKIVYLGRLEPSKGVDILIRAVTRSTDLDVRLDIYGIAQGKMNSYGRRLKQLAGSDARIVFQAPVSNEHIHSLLQAYDLLAVPSQGLETGPLVVLEAFAAGVPVLGSDLGGIAELVQSEVNGLLVEAGSVEAWRKALVRISLHRDLLPTWAKGIPAPRDMSDVAQEMDLVYNGLLCPR